MQIELLGVTGMLLCSTHLCVGLWIGYHLNRRRQIDPPHHPKAPFYLADMLELIEQSRRLRLAFEPHYREVPTTLVPAVRQVFQAAEALHKRVSTGPLSSPQVSSVKQIPRASVIQSIIDKTSPSLSSSEFMTLAADTACPASEAGSKLGAGRRPYNTLQNVAFFDSDSPAAHEFEQVQCHDLSVDGVSFLLNRTPDEENLVITLGTAPNLMFMTAKVVNDRLVFKDGREVFRIGCQFLNRVDPPRYQWNSELGIVERLAADQLVFSKE